MAWYKIYDTETEFGNKVLRTPAKKIRNFQDDKILYLRQQMIDICKRPDVAGIAAPQLGAPYKMFALSIDKTKPPRFFYNPEIIQYHEDTAAVSEGCLSVPHKHGIIERSIALLLAWQDENGRKHDKEGKPYQELFTGFEAQAVQHETDHCNGILYIDKTTQVFDALKMQEAFDAAMQEELEAQANISTTKIDALLDDENETTEQ